MRTKTNSHTYNIDMKILFLFITFISTLYLARTQNDCLPTRCSPTGPIIRFPFRLKDHQPSYCGHPDYVLSCTKNNITKLDLRFPIKTSTNNDIKISLQTTISVWDIDYKAQKLLASNAESDSCLPDKNTLVTTSFNSTNSRTIFEVEPLGYTEGSYTLFNCSVTRSGSINYGDQKIACLSRRGYQVIAFASFYDITSLPPYSSCFKMYNVSYVPDGMFRERDGDEDYGTRFYLHWHEPSCGDLCEKKDKYCRSRNGGGRDQGIECFSHQEPQHNNKGASRSQVTLTAGTIMLLLLITTASYFIFRSVKRKKEDQTMIERIIDSHKESMGPRRYSYADIKKITGNFNDTMYDTLLKGILEDKTRVVVKTNDCSEPTVGDFISQVEIIGRMQHANVLKLIGYCAGGQKRALVYESVQNQTLEDFLLASDEKSLYRIMLGVAKGINYVRQECAGRILNLRTSPRNILIDSDLEPKILVLLTAVGDRDDMSKKADVFSFGMLLLEILGRRNNPFHVGEKEKNGVYFPEWIYSDMSKVEEDNWTVKKLLIVGLWCIQWFPSDRPSMKCVVQMLEGDNMPTMPKNPFE